MLRNLLSNAGLILGTIFPYYKEDEPTNFLICNGQSCVGYEIEDIGITKVPDLRGKFTRMIGGNSLGMGIEQGDAIRNIKGRLFNFDRYINGNNPTNDGYDYGLGYIRENHNIKGWALHHSSNDHGSYTSDFMFDASKVVPTAVENRPINMAFNYIIYVGRKKKTHEFLAKLSYIASLFNSEVMLYA